MTAKRFSPFINEVDFLQIGKMRVANHFDRISLSGNLDITLDQEGLDTARALMDVLSLVMHELNHTELSATAAAPGKDPCR